MKIFCTASSDTYITNKIINGNTRVTDANVGRASVLDIFKLYDESSLPTTEKSNSPGDFNLDTDADGTCETAIELSRALIKFDLGKINSLTGSKLNLNSSNFSAHLKLFDVRSGHAVPRGFTVMAIPLSQSFDEGQGRDLSSFNDIDVSNFITASYSNGTTSVWNGQGASTSGSLGTLNVDLVDKANFGDGSGNRELVFNQKFVEGTEDLSLDITAFVSASVAGLIDNHGFRISFTGSEETDSKSRFIKRFASRHVSNPHIRPRIEVSFDDSKFDHHENFFFDMSGSLFLNQSQDTALVDRDTSLAKLVASAGKIKFEEYWVSTDETYGYHTGSVTISKIDRNSSNFITNEVSVHAINLESEYRTDDEITVRVFGRNFEKENDDPVKVPYSRKSESFEKIYYRIKDFDSGKTVFDFGEKDNSTRLSTDSEGMFFDFHIDVLPVGRSYTFEYLIVDRGIRKIVADKNAVFRVK